MIIKVVSPSKHYSRTSIRTFDLVKFWNKSNSKKDKWPSYIQIAIYSYIYIKFPLCIGRHMTLVGFDIKNLLLSTDFRRIAAYNSGPPDT
jgi:hypothetical protein